MTHRVQHKILVGAGGDGFQVAADGIHLLEGGAEADQALAVWAEDQDVGDASDAIFLDEEGYGFVLDVCCAWMCVGEEGDSRGQLQCLLHDMCKTVCGWVSGWVSEGVGTICTVDPLPKKGSRLVLNPAAHVRKNCKRWKYRVRQGGCCQHPWHAYEGR